MRTLPSLMILLTFIPSAFATGGWTTQSIPVQSGWNIYLGANQRALAYKRQQGGSLGKFDVHLPANSLFLLV